MRTRKKLTDVLDGIPAERIESKIYLIRGKKVILDRDLAELYGVTTGNLNKAVTRNMDRFPCDFMFQLTVEEMNVLRFQSGSFKRGKHSKYLSHAFTQEGVAMLSGVLHSQRAVIVNIAIMRAFIRLRELLMQNRDLAQKIERLERQFDDHDHAIKIIFETIQKLLEPPKEPESTKGPIGFI